MGNDAIKELIIDRLLIEDVYGSDLRKRGKSYEQRCPLHEEKTPSFKVDPGGKTFHCFGCGKGGDMYAFIMEKYKVDFPEALRILADRAGVHLKDNVGKYKRLYEINKAAQEYYSECLGKNPQAMQYITNRGYTEETIKKFHLGYAPGSSTVAFLRKRKFSIDEIVDAGLARFVDGQPMDFFYRRIMFPIVFQRKILGFSGRVIDDKDSPKFLNSPETPIFKKSELVYGFDKSSIKDKGFVVVVEGNSDVNMCHQYGHTNTVAPLGSALLKTHVDVLKKCTDAVYLMFDGDNPGRKAAVAAAGLLFEDRMKGGVLSLPIGEDPDSFLRKGNSIETLIKKSIPFGVFLVREFPHKRKMIIDKLLLRGPLEMAEFQAYMTTPEELREVEEFSARMALHRIIKRSPSVISRDNVDVKMHLSRLLLFSKGRFIMEQEINGNYKKQAEDMFNKAMDLREKMLEYKKSCAEKGV